MREQSVIPGAAERRTGGTPQAQAQSQVRFICRTPPPNEENGNKELLYYAIVPFSQATTVVPTVTCLQTWMLVD